MKDKITNFEGLVKKIKKLYKLEDCHSPNEYYFVFGKKTLRFRSNQYRLSFKSYSNGSFVKSKNPQKIYEIIKLLKECEDER
jgi:hypothetical protein